LLLFREKIPADWLPKMLANLPAVLVDHAHLERKAATTSITLEKYHELFKRVDVDILYFNCNRVQTLSEIVNGIEIPDIAFDKIAAQMGSGTCIVIFEDMSFYLVIGCSLQ